MSEIVHVRFEGRVACVDLALLRVVNSELDSPNLTHDTSLFGWSDLYRLEPSPDLPHGGFLEVLKYPDDLGLPLAGDCRVLTAAEAQEWIWEHRLVPPADLYAALQMPNLHAAPVAQEREAAPATEAVVPSAMTFDDWDALAVSFLVELHNNEVKKAAAVYPMLVAKKYPFTRSTIYSKLPRFKAMALQLGMMEKDANKSRKLPRGSKTKDGRIEAIDIRDTKA